MVGSADEGTDGKVVRAERSGYAGQMVSVPVASWKDRCGC